MPLLILVVLQLTRTSHHVSHIELACIAIAESHVRDLLPYPRRWGHGGMYRCFGIGKCRVRAAGVTHLRQAAVWDGRLGTTS